MICTPRNIAASLLGREGRHIINATVMVETHETHPRADCVTDEVRTVVHVCKLGRSAPNASNIRARLGGYLVHRC